LIVCTNAMHHLSTKRTVALEATKTCWTAEPCGILQHCLLV